MSHRIVRRGVAALAVGLAVTAVPATAHAADRSPWSTPTGQRFAAVVLACEQRSVIAPELRACVGDLMPPSSRQAEVMDLWRIFMSCLSLMPANVGDAMYPPSYYEDLVNDCLGL